MVEKLTPFSFMCLTRATSASNCAFIAHAHRPHLVVHDVMHDIMHDIMLFGLRKARAQYR